MSRSTYGGGDSNLYSFAWNNPRRWNDPSGLSATESGILSQVAPVAAAPAVGCAISTKLSELAAWLSGDGTYEVVGVKAGPGPCLVSPVLACRPGGRGGAGVGSGAGGGRGPGPNDDDDGDPCTPSWESESGYCFVLYPKGSKREEPGRRGCLERSRVRDSICRRTGAWPSNNDPPFGPPRWNDLTDCRDLWGPRRWN